MAVFFTKPETRLLRQFARQFIVAKFYDDNLDIFWQRVWKVWVDFDPLPRHPDMDMDEYDMRCQAQLKILQDKVRWVVWSYPAGIRDGEVLPEGFEDARD
ncbi:hypothetical protein H1R20_g15646, partial [Candolleomyces eurysporus]